MVTIRFDVTDVGGSDALDRVWSVCDVVALDSIGREWAAFCPVHDDRRAGGKRSLSITFRDGTIYFRCRRRACGANASDVAAALGLGLGDVLGDVPFFTAARGIDGSRPFAPRRRWRLPDGEYLVGASRTMLRGGEPLRWLTEVRGISLEVIERHLIGWTEEPWRRFLFPITEHVAWCDTPIPVGCLYRSMEPGPDGRPPKVRNWAGQPSWLYPGEPSTEWVLLAEGELDALAALSRSIPAVSGTTGAGNWSSDWTAPFGGRRVAIVYDADEAGRSGAEMVAAELSAVARSVTVVDLAPERDDGYDLTDWFRDGRTTDELKSLIHAAKRRKPQHGPGLPKTQIDDETRIDNPANKSRKARTK